MKIYLLSIAFVLCTFELVAQSQTAPVNVTIGEIYTIGTPETETYQYIDMPRPNFIMKRGGFPNYKDLEGRNVEVTSIKEKKDGTKKVTLKLKDGTRFFGSHRTLTTDFNNAFATGELRTY